MSYRKADAYPPGRNGKPPKWETQQQALALRSAGATYREIGKTLNIDHTWARRIVLDALNEAKATGVEELRNEDNHRLERMLRAVWQNAIAGDIPSINAALRILERRSRLNGLDAPVQVTMTADVDAQIEQLAREINVVQGEVTHGGNGSRPAP